MLKNLQKNIPEVIIILLVIAGIMVFISTIGLFVMWIKYSWIKRNNSKDFTGEEITKKLFQENHINPKIKKSFFYVKYWNHKKKTNTYKLRPWTYSRKSIWTMMEASQQAYATIIRQTNKKTFWLVFRIPQIIAIGGLLIGSGIIFLGLETTKQVGTSIDINWKTILGISIVIFTIIFSLVWRSWLLRKNVPNLIKNCGLNKYELNAIKKIFTWFLVYAIAQAILQIIRIILRVAEMYNNKSN